MTQRKKKVLFLFENEEIELELFNSLNKLSSNLDLKAVSIKYWLFRPNFTKYDVLIIPFLPSAPSTHYDLFSKSLEAGIPILVLNWWQNNHESEFNYLNQALSDLAAHKLYLCSWKSKFTELLLKYKYDRNIYECKNPLEVILQNDLIGSQKENSKEIFFLIDFDTAFITSSLREYRLKTGYKEEDLNNRIERSEKFALELINEISSLCRHNPNLHISLSNYSAEGNFALNDYLEKNNFSFPKNFSINTDRIVSKMINSRLNITNDQSIYTSLLNVGINAIYYDNLISIIRSEKELGIHNHPSFSFEMFENNFISGESYRYESNSFPRFIDSISNQDLTYIPFFLLSIRIKLMAYNVKQHIKKFLKTL